jgi:hypothetical protein
MRKLVLAAALCVGLAACNNKTEAPDAAVTPEATETVAAASTTPGTYEFTADGKATMSMINADGTYQDMVDGKTTEKGLWSEHDGKVCFDPEGDEAGMCYTTTEPDAEGMFTATADDGTVLKIKKTA